MCLIRALFFFINVFDKGSWCIIWYHSWRSAICTFGLALFGISVFWLLLDCAIGSVLYIASLPKDALIQCLPVKLLTVIKRVDILTFPLFHLCCALQSDELWFVCFCVLYPHTKALAISIFQLPVWLILLVISFALLYNRFGYFKSLPRLVRSIYCFLHRKINLHSLLCLLRYKFLSSCDFCWL